MTIGIECSDAANSKLENGSDQYKYRQVLKSQKAHERSIIGLRVFQNPRSRQMVLATFAHDSLKIWSISAFENEFSLFTQRTISPWNCGIQSFTTSADGNKISVVSTDCSLHHISFAETHADDPQFEVVQHGMMEIWFVLAIPSIPNHFLTVNFQAGQLQIINQTGDVVSGAPFERARHVSSIAYSDHFVAIGTSQGLIFVLNSSTLATLYSTEAHAMKVRCLEFIGGADEPEPRLLSASDDKTIKLFSLIQSKALLMRVFCGHTGIVTGLAVCQASGGERFASSGAGNCIIIWATESGEKLHVFANCTETINDVPRSVCFTPNGRYLIAGTEECTILAYRVPQPANYVEEELPHMEETEEEEEMEMSGEPGLMMMNGEEENGEYQPEGGDNDHFAHYGEDSPSNRPAENSAEEDENRIMEQFGNTREGPYQETQQPSEGEHFEEHGEGGWGRRELEEQLGID